MQEDRQADGEDGRNHAAHTNSLRKVRRTTAAWGPRAP